MFKKVMMTWAKEMDKQRYKEQDKRQKRVYYVDVCVDHMDRINDEVTECTDYVIKVDELLTEEILPVVQIEFLEKCISHIKYTIQFVVDNGKLYDLPENAKQAYNDSISHLITGLNYFLKAYETKVEIQKMIAIINSDDVTQDDIDYAQKHASNLIPIEESLNQFIHYRKLQLNKYETALNIINSH